MVMEECGIGALTYLYLRASFCDGGSHLFSLLLYFPLPFWSVYVFKDTKE